MDTYTANDIKADGARIAARLISDSVEADEISNILVADRKAAEALLWYIQDDIFGSDSAYFDADRWTVLDVWGVDNDEREFRIRIRFQP